jgi:hypothetical protein
MNWIREDIMNPYLDVCRRAVEDDEVFAVFKSLPAYRKILEHTSQRQGEIYMYKIPGEYDVIKFMTNDVYGSPEMFPYSGYLMSPTTLQYIYVLSRLEKLFGSLGGFRIAEIGGGYGGQSKIIQDKYRVDYHLYDHPDVVNLQMKYLGKFNMSATGILYSAAPLGYDLVISNYALSEITEPLLTEYVRKILLHSKHGYITCNGQINAMQEIKDKFPSFNISPDIEGERETNYIITW